MPVVYLTTFGLRASLVGERLEIKYIDKNQETARESQWIPLIDVERVVVDYNAHISSKSITGLLSREIPIVFMKHGSFPAGLAIPMNRQVVSLADQLDRSRDNQFRLEISKKIVSAKIKNMRRVIQRLSANRKMPAIAAQWLNAMVSQAEGAGSIESLRGVEGAASGRYFEVISSFFPKEMPFERRSRRPPHNEANSLLSFAYTLLATEFSLYIRGVGLEPGWGVYHESEDRRPALSLDLMEPFRAPVADALVLDLLNHNRVKLVDFERIDGGYLMKEESRRRLYAAWEERLEREFMYSLEGYRTQIRQLIEKQCLAIKQAFRAGDPELYRPFLMN